MVLKNNSISSGMHIPRRKCYEEKVFRPTSELVQGEL